MRGPMCPDPDQDRGRRRQAERRQRGHHGLAVRDQGRGECQPETDDEEHQPGRRTPRAPNGTAVPRTQVQSVRSGRGSPSHQVSPSGHLVAMVNTALFRRDLRREPRAGASRCPRLGLGSLDLDRTAELREVDHHLADDLADLRVLGRERGFELDRRAVGHDPHVEGVVLALDPEPALVGQRAVDTEVFEVLLADSLGAHVPQVVRVLDDPHRVDHVGQFGLHLRSLDLVPRPGLVEPGVLPDDADPEVELLIDRGGVERRCACPRRRSRRTSSRSSCKVLPLNVVLAVLTCSTCVTNGSLLRALTAAFAILMPAAVSMNGVGVAAAPGFAGVVDDPGKVMPQPASTTTAASRGAATRARERGCVAMRTPLGWPMVDRRRDRR